MRKTPGVRKLRAIERCLAALRIRRALGFAAYGATFTPSGGESKSACSTPSSPYGRS